MANFWKGLLQQFGQSLFGMLPYGLGWLGNQFDEDFSKNMGKMANDLSGMTANQEWQSAEAEKSRQFQQQQWMQQAEYNSPANQMARYKAAGLNPDLMYSQGQTLPIQTSSAQASGGAGSTDPLSLINGISQMMLTRAQVNNLNADTEGKKIENNFNSDDEVTRARKLEIANNAQKALSDANFSASQSNLLFQRILWIQEHPKEFEAYLNREYTLIPEQELKNLQAQEKELGSIISKNDAEAEWIKFQKSLAEATKQGEIDWAAFLQELKNSGWLGNIMYYVLPMVQMLTGAGSGMMEAIAVGKALGTNGSTSTTYTNSWEDSDGKHTTTSTVNKPRRGKGRRK